MLVKIGVVVAVFLLFRCFWVWDKVMQRGRSQSN